MLRAKDPCDRAPTLEKLVWGQQAGPGTNGMWSALREREMPGRGLGGDFPEGWVFAETGIGGLGAAADLHIHFPAGCNK